MKICANDLTDLVETTEGVQQCEIAERKGSRHLHYIYGRFEDQVEDNELGSNGNPIYGSDIEQFE